MKIKEALLLGISTLTNPNKLLESELLLAKSLNKNIEFIICNENYPLSKQEKNQFIDLLNKRLKHKPISQLLKEKEFYCRKFIVDDNVLTPRPETELLTEIVINYIKRHKNKTFKIADICTGSGCIPITISLEIQNKELNIYGYDISKEALQIAHTNKKKFKIKNVKFIKKDILKENITHKFDVIISNPPYIPLLYKKSLPLEVSLYEPEIALFGGYDGLLFYNRLYEIIRDSLIPGGKAFLEIFPKNTNKVKSLFEKNYSTKIVKDYSKNNRFLEVTKTD